MCLNFSYFSSFPCKLTAAVVSVQYSWTASRFRLREAFPPSFMLNLCKLFKFVLSKSEFRPKSLSIRYKKHWKIKMLPTFFFLVWQTFGLEVGCLLSGDYLTLSDQIVRGKQSRERSGLSSSEKDIGGGASGSDEDGSDQEWRHHRDRLW